MNLFVIILFVLITIIAIFYIRDNKMAQILVNTLTSRNSKKKAKQYDWFMNVNKIYKQILDDSSSLEGGSVMIDVDETILYEFNKKIPGSDYFVNKLAEKFDVYLVTGRNEISRTMTERNLKDYKYKELIMRPSELKHGEFKLKIQTQLKPVFSVADQIVDYPTYLIPNPFYKLDADGTITIL